jgi:DnaK suppressor protein
MPRKTSYRQLKEILQKRRDALRRVLTHDLSALRNGAGIDIGDSVDNAVDDEFNLVSSQLAQSESRELAQIDEALARIRAGDYGICDGCGEQIPLARLQALPYATRCVKCQRASESDQSSAASRIDWSAIRDSQEDEPEFSLTDHLVDMR